MTRAAAGHGRFGRVRLRLGGWRAFAVPLLTLATVATLTDLVLAGPAPGSGPDRPLPAASSAASSSASSSPSSSSVSSSSSSSASSASPPSSPSPSSPPSPATPVPAAAAAFVERGTGTLHVVGGTSTVFGRGPLRRFAVEVENGIDVDGAAFARAVEATLSDRRSWGHGGQLSFQRVADARQADFRVALVSPGSMEAFCPGVGTRGYTSCRYGDRAVVNLARWQTAVPDYRGDVATYRLYVVNHEVGHVLGHGHEPCPGPGRLAPVMQQQTLGLDGCRKNPWPYP